MHVGRPLAPRRPPGQALRAAVVRDHATGRQACAVRPLRHAGVPPEALSDEGPPSPAPTSSCRLSTTPRSIGGFQAIGRPLLFVIGTIAALTVRFKGIQTALEASAPSVGDYRPFELQVVGAGDPPPWRKLASRCGVDGPRVVPRRPAAQPDPELARPGRPLRPAELPGGPAARVDRGDEPRLPGARLDRRGHPGAARAGLPASSRRSQALAELIVRAATPGLATGAGARGTSRRRRHTLRRCSTRCADRFWAEFAELRASGALSVRDSCSSTRRAPTSPQAAPGGMSPISRAASPQRGHDVHVLAAFPVRRDGACEHDRAPRHHWRESRTRRWRNHLGDLASHPGRRPPGTVAPPSPSSCTRATCPASRRASGRPSAGWSLPLVHTLLDYHLLCPRSSLTRRDGTPCCPTSPFCAVRTRRFARWAAAVSHVIAGSEHMWAREGASLPSSRGHHRAGAARTDDGAAPGCKRRRQRSSATSAALIPSRGSRAARRSTRLRRLGLRVRIAGDGRLRGDVEAVGRRRVRRAMSTEPRRSRSSRRPTSPSCRRPGRSPGARTTSSPSGCRPRDRFSVSTRGGLAEARGLPGVTAIEPTASRHRRGRPRARRAGYVAARHLGPSPVADNADVDRWLDQHEASYALAARASSTCS